MEKNNERRSVFDWILLAFSVVMAILLICALSVPMLTVSQDSSSSSSSSNICIYLMSTGSIGSIVLACLGFAGALIPGLTKKSGFRWLGIGCGLVFAVFSFCLKSTITNALDLASGSTSLNETVTTTGIDIMLTCGILFILEFVVYLIAEVFGKPLLHLLASAASNQKETTRTPEERLATLNKLHAEGTIDDATYEEKKKEIINEL